MAEVKIRSSEPGVTFKEFVEKWPLGTVLHLPLNLTSIAPVPCFFHTLGLWTTLIQTGIDGSKFNEVSEEHLLDGRAT